MNDVKNIDIDLNSFSSQTLDTLKRYTTLLSNLNERVRLTGPRDFSTLWNEHILDCLPLTQLLPKEGSIVDIGTGGGLPGMVLAICRPHLTFTLVDSLSRKTHALEQMVAELDLSNVIIRCCRSEDLALELKESYDAAAVRAVSETGIIAEYLSPLVRVGGTLLAMKGPSWQEEIAPIEDKWDKIGLDAPTVYQYQIKDHSRYILSWQKAYPIGDNFPRRPGRAEKKPWWK